MVGVDLKSASSTFESCLRLSASFVHTIAAAACLAGILRRHNIHAMLKLHQAGILFFELVNECLQRFRMECEKHQFPQDLGI